MRRLTFILGLMFCFAALAGCGCGDDDDDSGGDDATDDDIADDDVADDDSADDDSADDDADDDIDDDADDDCAGVEEQITDGKYWLGFPDGDRARGYFLDALETAPQCTDAIYGLVLADTVHTTDVLSIIVDYIDSLEYGGPVATELSGDDLLNALLQSLLDGLLRERAVELVGYADQALASDASFTHDGIPLFVNYEQVADLHTEFDAADLHAMSAFAGLFNGLFHQLYAIDLDCDIFTLYMLVEADFDSMTPTEILSYVVDLFLELLTDPAYPNFLTVTENGAEEFKEAGLEIGKGFDAWTRFFPAIDAETDDPADDMAGYSDLNGNRSRDDYENYVLPYFGELNADGMEWVVIANDIAAGLRDSYLDYTEFDTDPLAPNPFPLALLKPAARELGIPAFIIPDWKIDIGSWYVDPEGSGFRDTLVSILQILDAFLPAVQR